ncbi:MAG TPA: bifunctional phosphoribosylaminoimidazolecarboxamide formyltransferase/IMP cyclohydrolase [Acidimicrobiales bacterium]|nr:bifunctional phosphoribosylaminoimidazolecarboxamide formyltransferase/IMP cyclohydrolase [Acidimicrobiales bacterium]
MTRRALLSVYDKTGIEDLASGLVALGWELLASTSTGRALAEAGIPHRPLAELTGFADMLDHRVVTLHPAVHGGILADRSKASHLADLERHGLAPIDLVVVNLYPFLTDPSVDLIDIGGPTMVRAAAKNHAHVGVVVDPSEYPVVLEELRASGELGPATRLRLARAAFAATAAYDAAIVGWLDRTDPDRPGLPPTVHLAMERAQELRYGENPHQQGARYRPMGAPGFWDRVVQHSGMELSYLNLFDAEAAWALVHDLADGPVAAVIKHANPCGVAVAPTLAEAYQRAYECDEQSAFGGIVALSRRVDTATAERMVAAAQADVVIAPGYDDGVVEALRRRRRNTRILEAPPPGPAGLEIRQLGPDFLVQQPHHFARRRADWQVVTRVAPTEAQWRDAELAWRICGWVKSNAIVLVRDGQAVGIGAGQQKRVDSGEIAARKAAGRAKGGACASDAFYPFPDGVEAAVEAGAAVVIQPGGGMRDEDVIATADEHGIAMVLTGERHFRH